MEIDFIGANHKKTNRNYLEKVNKVNKERQNLLLRQSSGDMNTGMAQEILIMADITTMEMKTCDRKINKTL